MPKFQIKLERTWTESAFIDIQAKSMDEACATALELMHAVNKEKPLSDKLRERLQTGLVNPIEVDAAHDVLEYYSFGTEKEEVMVRGVWDEAGNPA